MTIKILSTKEYDPWRNLAIEEYLLESLSPDDTMLYLWQNAHTVVIGKNQNPWRECKAAMLEKEGGKLARRISGGGAVYHDLGNLNFSFILSKEKYNLDKQFQVIIDAMKLLGINAIKTGRNDLVVNDQKFSGNAFCVKKIMALHHGTLLVNADLSNLGKYLQVSKEKMKAKGVKSVKSRVINLAKIVKGLTIDNVREAMITSFQNTYGKASEVNKSSSYLDQKRINQLYEKYTTWEYTYGDAPAFDITFGKRFSFGEIQFHLSLKKGKIQEIKIYSDMMNEKFISELEQVLLGSNYKKDDIINHMRVIRKEEYQEILDELITYIDNREF